MIEKTVPPEYHSLFDVLMCALDQASVGKGKERHARGQAFEDQRMQTISQLLNTDKGMAYQAAKKLFEGIEFIDPARQEHELLGVIVYVAGIIVYNRESGVRHDGSKDDNTANQHVPEANDQFDSLRARKSRSGDRRRC